MAEIEIITLPPEDWQRYREIRLEALQTDPQAYSTTYATTVQKLPEYFQERLAEAARGEKSWLLFAQTEGRLVGIAGAYRTEGSPSAEIISVYVSPSWRGQGIGKALITAILQVLSRNPIIQTATITVNKEQNAAVALYVQLGFQITGQVESVMGNGKTYTEYQMQKAL